jgi:hypothetical protein
MNADKTKCRIYGFMDYWIDDCDGFIQKSSNPIIQKFTVLSVFICGHPWLISILQQPRFAFMQR